MQEKCSPTLLAVEDNMTKRRHFVTNNDQHQLSGADCVNSRDPVLVQSDLLLQNREVNSINAKEVPVGNDLLHASLRKCSKTPNSAVKCHTPGSLIMQSRSHDTPRSTGGSSIFSPGESFWNEAIQVVDGLFSQTDNCVSRPVDELNMANRQFKTGASLNKRDGNCNGKSEVMTQEDKSNIQLMEVTASTGTVERSARVSVKDVSSLPVRHFDFSCEDKNLDGNSSYGCPLSDKNGVTPASVQSSVNKKTLQNLWAEAHQYAGSHEVQDTTSLQVVSKGKVALLNHGISPNTLDQEFRSSLNHQYSIEPSTPSSFAPLEDCLDISNWLPSEICCIYQKRGITKLYQWQVNWKLLSRHVMKTLSLGVDIPQLDQPLLPTAAVNCSNKEAKNASSGEESISNLENQKHVSGLPAAVEIESPDISASEIDRIRAPVLNIGLSTSADVKVTREMVHCSVPRDAEAVKNTVVDLVDTKNVTHAVQSRNTCHGRRICNVYPYNECQDSHIREKSCLSNMDSVYAKGPVNAHALPGGFDAFLNLWDSAEEFYFDVHFNQLSGTNSLVTFEMQGIAVCWANSPVYYVNIPKDLLWSANSKSMSSSMMGSSAGMNNYVSENQLEIAKGRWSRICYIMGKGNVRKFSWNLKLQLKVLKKPLISVSRIGNMSCAVKYVGTQVDSSYVMLSPVYVKNGIDMCIVAWILWPDEERSSIPNLEKGWGPYFDVIPPLAPKLASKDVIELLEAKKRLPNEAAAAANRSGRWKNQMRRAAHNGCCRRVAQTRALGSTLWGLVVSEELVEELLNMEVPLVNVLADMEEWGIGVDMEGCLQARHLVEKAEVSREGSLQPGWNEILFDCAGFKTVGVLDCAGFKTTDLRVSFLWEWTISRPRLGVLVLAKVFSRILCPTLVWHHHPIVPIIKEHRTLAQLLNCTLGSMCSMAKLSVATQRYTLHGHWLQTATATGRLCMEESSGKVVLYVDVDGSFQTPYYGYQHDNMADLIVGIYCRRTGYC
ncbi:hypothetical protein RJ641_006000 [Dillenia turbinata]|uniref:Uncharacterized protein n=1 Tax=Dillenia turbinata TaxID=194707 RepID=A0AAN8V9E1_9MAGN